MMTRDLFELASLDVLGLLDDEERREFERAFRAAPPAVQAQVRREQLRAAHAVQSDEWLPAVDTPTGLKGRVVSSVREAIDAARAGEFSDHMSRKIGFFTLALQRNVSPLWRAACIGLLTASAVLGVALVRQSQQYDGIREAIAGDVAVKGHRRAVRRALASTLTDPHRSSARSPRFTRRRRRAGRLVVDESGAAPSSSATSSRPATTATASSSSTPTARSSASLSLLARRRREHPRTRPPGLATATLAIIPGSGPMTADRAARHRVSQSGYPRFPRRRMHRSSAVVVVPRTPPYHPA